MNLDKWHLLCHASEVRENQSYVSVKFHDEEIICYRQDSKLLAFKNFCPHRGSRLVNDSCGLWEGKCPYHGLEYKNLKETNASKLGFNKKSSERLHLKISNAPCL